MLCTMISLIISLCSMMYILMILVSNTDFFSSFDDVSDTHHHDMLFSMIIHILLVYLSSVFEDFSLIVELSHINSCLLWWTFSLSHSSCFAQLISVDLWVFLTHLMTMSESDFSLILLILDAFLSLLLMQVIMLSVSNYRWSSFLIMMM